MAGVLFVLSANDAPDIRTVGADLRMPALESAPAAAGKRIKEVLPRYKNTNVYHVTYLPTDWKREESYPVIVEYAGNGEYSNQYGDKSTGRVEGSKLGYGISKGRGFIWVCLPYLNDQATENVIKWWGDPPDHNPQATVDYCNEAVPWICARYGGDPHRVVLTGFSRGAIAVNFIGLHDAKISQLWCAFIPFSHYDGVVKWGYLGSDRAAALGRLQRLGYRPQFVCSEEGSGNHSVSATSRYLAATGIRGDFTFRGTGFRNHNDAWILRPSKTRSELRRWVRDVMNSK